MPKRPTVYDVAHRASVSIATVSFAYRRPDKVKPETRERVLAAARDLGYVPSASARGLANGRTGALGLFAFDYLLDGGNGDSSPAGSSRSSLSELDDLDDLVRLFPLYVDEVQRGIELECRRRGYALLLNGGGREDAESVVADIAGRVDGLAVFPDTVPHAVLLKLAERMPVVELSEPAQHGPFGHVTVDNGAGAQSLTEHLIQAHGLADLQFVMDHETSDNRARFKGFQRALRAARLPVPSRPLRLSAAPGDGSLSLADVVDRAAMPSGLVCCNDQKALAVIDWLSDAGFRVPEQVAVTGFDGIFAGRLSRPALTTVRQPMEEMGRAAVDLLIEQLTVPDKAPRQRRMSTRLVVRNSCGCRPV